MIVNIDSQKLVAISRCHRLANFQFGENYTPIESNPFFDRGSYGHAILEGFTEAKLDGKSRNDSIEAGFSYGLEWMIENSVHLETDERYLIDDSLKLYFKYYENSRWIVRGAEKYLSKVLYESDELTILYDGVVDWFVDTEIGPAIADHKFRSRDQPFYELNDQMIGYAFLAETNLVYEDRVGLQKTLPVEKRFKRYLARFNEQIINDWKLSATRRIIRYVNAVGTDYFEPNFSNCQIGYGPCTFHGVCKSENPEEVLKAEFTRREPWDPMKKR